MTQRKQQKHLGRGKRQPRQRERAGEIIRKLIQSLPRAPSGKDSTFQKRGRGQGFSINSYRGHKEQDRERERERESETVLSTVKTKSGGREKERAERENVSFFFSPSRENIDDPSRLSLPFLSPALRPAKASGSPSRGRATLSHPRVALAFPERQRPGEEEASLFPICTRCRPF